MSIGMCHLDQVPCCFLLLCSCLLLSVATNNGFRIVFTGFLLGGGIFRLCHFLLLVFAEPINRVRFPEEAANALIRALIAFINWGFLLRRLLINFPGPWNGLSRTGHV